MVPETKGKVVVSGAVLLQESPKPFGGVARNTPSERSSFLQRCHNQWRHFSRDTGTSRAKNLERNLGNGM